MPNRNCQYSHSTLLRRVVEYAAPGSHRIKVQLPFNSYRHVDPSPNYDRSIYAVFFNN